MAEYIPQLSILLAMDWLIGGGKDSPSFATLVCRSQLRSMLQVCTSPTETEWTGLCLQACSGPSPTSGGMPARSHVWTTGESLSALAD
jgi:hypothetical protein